MKKFGLTLAEMLTTLGIIGIIATLTIPNTIGKVGNTAQIGPKLAKTISNFEQANQTLLTDNGIEKLTDLENFENENYINELSKYLKFTAQTNGIVTKDGILLRPSASDTAPTNSSDPAYKQRIGEVYIDINGINTNPNEYSKDIFIFSWWNDGSLRPKGATNWNENKTSQFGGTEHWTKLCPTNATPSDPSYCAGHIFENNLKVLYQ